MRVIVVAVHDISVDLQMCGVVLYACQWSGAGKVDIAAA
jgi:hypothetical protein